ncbi:MAG: acetoacetate--CoA ligase, partial [Actinobacteria bacterium]|nr:acetoacetate--CoA ligase [Actinomycetota bacterium]
MNADLPLWRPSEERAAGTRLAAFATFVSARCGVVADSYPKLHEWSVREPAEFWSAVWDFCAVPGARGSDRVVEPADPFWRTRFFPEAELNVAHALLREPTADAAILHAREDGMRRSLTRAELHGLVSRIQQALRAAGVEQHDRVVAWMPNAPETFALMLAAASLGAVFSSTSPDFGPDGVVDRFGQIEPTVLVAVDGYLYGGKRFDCLGRLAEIRERLPSVSTIVVFEYLDAEPSVAHVRDAVTWSRWLEPYRAAPLEFVPLQFDHPWYVLFSSGTTGAPKCIVHRAGGVLLKHLSEQQLHCDVRPGDRVCYFTTAGWMMWNWLASVLATDATIVAYDGSPAFPGRTALFDLTDELGITLFGTSARFLDELRKAGERPVDSHDLSTVRTIASTGSPLVPEGFAYVYDAVKRDVHLASISGGTDLCGCLVGGDPTGPVWAGEIQRPSLGMAIAVVDEDGVPLQAGARGELVCEAAFPSIPLGLWNDPDDARFRATYFERFPGRWHQGDFAEWTRHGGMVIHGRSDATLNPGGVRIGTAEIYRQVETVAEVADCLVIGQQWEGDTRIVMFVVMQPGESLTSELASEMRARIRAGASPRHVPAKIVAVPELPRTRSNKLSELAV